MITTGTRRRCSDVNRYRRCVCGLILVMFMILIPVLSWPTVFAGPLPDTGQTKCYNNTSEIPCPQPGEPFYGQDGNYTINPPSYTKLDNQGNALPDDAASWTMVRDNVTGLIWENKTNDGSIHSRGKIFSWCDRNPATNSGIQGTCGTGTGSAATDTDAFIKALNETRFGGFSDWRLPTVKELNGILSRSYDSSRSNSGLNPAWFPNTAEGFYWSSDRSVQNQYEIWGLYYGQVCAFHVSYPFTFVRAVRGAQSGLAGSLVINDDGTVTDTAMGLMWQQATIPNKNWQEALSYAENLSLAGYDDWRLPNVNELQSMADYHRFNPSIDTTAFPGTVPSNYLSSTTESDYAGSYSVWFVNFEDGSSTNSYKTYTYAIRAVRGGQSRYLVGSTPIIGARWHIGSPQVITWDNAGISGNVKITLSRQGGKSGTYTEVIVASTPNNGFYNWTVTGPGSANCALRIEPLSDPSRGTNAGLFAIGDTWLIGELKKITWDKGSFSGGVKISLSRQGGAADTFETIAAATENDGSYQWNVTGPASDRGIVKIESLANPEQAASTGLYTILSDTISHYFIKAAAISTLQQYNLYLMGKTVTSGAEIPVDGVSWTVSDPTVASLNGIMIQGLKSGIVTVSTTYQGKEYRKLLYFKTGFDQFENQNNNTLEKAQLLTDGRYMEGELLRGQADYYKITLPADSLLELSYFSYSTTADVRLELFDEESRPIATVDSSNGQSRTLNLGLRSGSNFVKLSYIGDVDENTTYALIHKITSPRDPSYSVETEPNDAYQQAVSLRIDETYQGQFLTISDIDFYAMNVPNPVYLDLLFTCPDSPKSFDIFIYKETDQNLINRIQATGGAAVTLPMGLSIGKYFIKVSAAGADGETEAPYFLTLKPSSLANIEIESNNTYRFANPIDPASGRTGRIFSGQDVDYYGFSLQQPGFFEIYFTPAPTTIADYKISLVDKDDQIFYAKTSQNGQATTLRFNRDLPGNYYIKVESAGDIDQYGDYRISMSGSNIAGLKSPATISIAAPKTAITAGEEIQLTATAYYTDATTEGINPAWSSLDPAIASIDQTGKLKGIVAGRVTVVAVSGGLSGQIALTVGSPASGIVNHHGNLILVGGGGYAQTNTIKDATLYLSDLVYRRFKERLFSDDDIYYFHPWPAHDINGDGYPENIVRDTSPTAAKLGAAITQWAASQSTDGPLYLYLIDHGGMDYFTLFENQDQVKENLTATQLKGFIDAFQSATNRQVIVIIEACRSGSFADDLVSSGQNRIVVASTNDQYQLLSRLGTDSFTQLLIDKLWEGDSLHAAFTKARQKLATMGSPYNRQIPQLKEGISLAANTVKIGGDFAVAGAIPLFLEQSPNAAISANTNRDIFARFDSAVIQDIEKVWGVVVPPIYEASGTDIQTIQFPVVDLADSERSGRYTGSYSAFAYNGEYRIVFYARTTNGNIIVSAPAVFSVTGGIDTPKTLTVTKSGTGAGTITSQPVGIDCGEDCTETYTSSTSVVLTAAAASGSVFIGWTGGGCGETGSCTVNVNATLDIMAEFSYDARGDLNGDGATDLTDAILVLKVITGIAPAPGTPGGVRADYISSGADVNGDNKIGLPEAVYILQKASGVR